MRLYWCWCNMTTHHWCRPAHYIVPGLCGYFKLFLEYVVCFAVTKPGPADELTVTFVFAKGTSVYKAAFPRGTCSLVKGITEAGRRGRVPLEP